MRPKAMAFAGTIVSVAASAALLQTAARAQDQERPSPQEIVAARQAAFNLSAAAMGNIKGAIDRGDAPSTQAFAARGVARWARVLPTLFPPGTTTVTPTRARPEIFTNRADFESKAAAYATAAQALAAAARGDDREAFAASFRATIATCSACHDLYQVPNPPRQ